MGIDPQRDRKMTDRHPTSCQLAAWDALDRLTIERKMPPSILDLMDATGTTSKSVMKHRLDSGVRRGRIAIVPCRGGAKYVPVWWEKMVNENLGKYANT